MAAPSPAFVHGDCHTENLPYGKEGLVFCDWAAAGTGRASSDLALLSVRATPAGVTVPLDAYPAGTELRRAILAEELAMLVFEWPKYAGYNTPEGNARIQERARRLVASYLR
jgi:aminoglycoside phosphotransferase (APT) family kinase protein